MSSNKNSAGKQATLLRCKQYWDVDEDWKTFSTVALFICLRGSVCVVGRPYQWSPS